MSAFWKDIFREIKNSLGRFISLFIITALGAASVVGIQAATIDMRDIADKRYKAANLYDLQIKSSTGFDDGDVAALSAAGVSAVMPTYVFDVLISFGQDVRATRAYALPDTLNDIELLEGRLPENANECAVEERMLQDGGLAVGDSLRAGLDNMDDYYKVFGNDTLTIVGVVSSPFYITHERGSTALGDGTLSFYMYLHPSAYKLDVYTDVYLLMDGSQEMYNLSDDYYDKLAEWKFAAERVADARVTAKEAEFADARQELDDGWAEYYDGVKELEEKLADGRKELADAEQKFKDVQKEIADAEQKLKDGQRELDEKIAEGLKEIEKNAKDLQNGQDELDMKRSELNEGYSRLWESEGELTQNLSQLEAIAPYGISPELDAQYSLIYAGLAQISEKMAEIDAGRDALAAAQKELDNGRVELDKARLELEAERAKAQKEIDDGWAEYYEGLNEYNQGLKEYKEGIEKLETEEADARKKLGDAKAELEDAQEKLDGAPEPEWFIFTRKDGVAYDSYYQDTSRLEKIGYVFPLVFYLVAVMVSLTSMSRMVEERRTQIGLYKALGYRPAAIMMKYLVYSLLASAGGSLLGVRAGSIMFPHIISDAYSFLYHNMTPVETPVPLFISVIAVVFSVGTIVAVTLATCIGSMTEAPAHLMRPKPPAIGKRVLLERIPFIWKHLSFIGKVTARNIFRYKKRFFMTLVGIMGCSALLVTGFGLRDGVGGVADMQYGKLVNYDARAYLKDITSDSLRSEIDAVLACEHLYIREEAFDASGVSGGLPASVIVPEKPEELIKYINLRTRQTGDPVPLGGNGVLVTEKLARVMGVSVGGSFTMTASDGKTYTAVLTGIVENYIMHHIYMAPAVYSEIFDEIPHPNSVLALTDDTSGLASALLGNKNVRAVVQTTDLLNRLSDATDAMGVVTIVLIVLACSLAMIVLFNLTNINITERVRELATIKVLGFYNNEVSMYVYRENAAVTALGIAAGLVGGMFLHRFVLTSAEIDMLMFPIVIRPLSYLYSVLLSAAFAIFVNLVMNVKLARIDMVESLKNVE